MTQRNLRIVVIGAGMAGMLAAIKLREQGLTDIGIYEKADRVGGTWRENTYPGLTCDVPSHHYTYTFERNPDWSRYLPPGGEIQDYFERTADKYGLTEQIRFNTEVTRATFEDGRWQLELASGERDSADVVIAATGVLHHPRTPHIEGADTFAGQLFHSARWDHSVPLEGKRIGIIGNGSTGVQLVSALAGRAALVEHYQRTAQWIMPTMNEPYSDADRARFRQDPEALLEAMAIPEYNAAVERYTEAITDMDSEAAQFMAQACLDNLEHGVRDPALKERLRPDHRPLCKRLIFSPDYYEKIQHPQAALVTEAIERIEPGGIRTTDGELHELDIIIIATGFHADAFMRPMQITGRGGRRLDDYWQAHPKAYLAISMPDFPNLFMLNGPNGPVGNFSLIDIAEHQWHYVAQLIERLRSTDTEISVSETAMEDFEARRIAAARETVWYRGGCQSWYLDAQGVPASWPWNYSRFVAAMEAPNWDHYDCRPAG